MRQSERLVRTGFIAALFGLPFFAPALAKPPAPAAEPVGAELVRADAKALAGFCKSGMASRFLDATEHLPSVSPRTIYMDQKSGKWYSEAAWKALPDAAKNAAQPFQADESRYYTTKYGSPLAYVRLLDVLAAHGMTKIDGARILDYGYGTVGHLRLFAALGCDAVGVDVDPFLTALYSDPGDQGRVKVGDKYAGSVTLIDGQWPANKRTKDAVGVGYDLIISKNTLKMGYIHPAKAVDPRMLVHMGVEDKEFVRAIASALKPGGYALLFNICPAQSPDDKKYIPWADGRCPFEKELWTDAGFDIVEFDKDDSAAVRKMAHILGWDAGSGGMDLEKDLFAHYSLFRRKPIDPQKADAAPAPTAGKAALPS